jgi:hypothetical protein
MDEDEMGTGDIPEVTPIEDDPVAMMLGLVPDKRTPGQRAWDATLPWERP